MAKKRVHIFVENCNFRFLSKMQHFFRFFPCSTAKSRRRAERPTVLSSLLNILTILIIFIKNFFFTNFLDFLRKMAKMKNLITL